MAIILKNIFKPKSQKEILDRLNNLKSDSVGLWGVMTVSQMLHHLSMANQIALGEIVLPDKSRFLSRTVFRWMTYLNMRPSVTRLKKKSLRTYKEVDIVRNKISVQDFETEKQLFIQKLNQVISSNKFPERHPLFGSMKKNGWGRWIFVHCDYHLVQFGV